MFFIKIRGIVWCVVKDEASIAEAVRQTIAAFGKIDMLAYRLGFEYNSHFTKFFKSKTGLSPTAFLAGEN